MKTLSLFIIIIVSFGNIQAQTVEVNREKIKAIIANWNTAHNEKDYSKLKKLYAPEVLFYSQELSRRKCIEKKANLFKTYRDFEQHIISGELILTAYSNGKIKCEFTKEVNVNNRVKQYPSYLVLVKNENSYLISGESDKITDHNLNYVLNLGPPVGIVNIEEKKTISVVSNNAFSSLFQKIAFAILMLLVIGFVLKFFLQRLRTPAVIPLTNNVKRKIENVRSPNSIHYSVTQENVLFSPSITGLENLMEEERVPTSAEIGYEFEKYAVTKFDDRYFKLKEWRSDKIVNGISAKSNQYPDLQYEFKLKEYCNEFAVECKFRSGTFNETIKFSESYKLDRYRDFQNSKNIKVYIFLGLGGSPSAPKELFVIPLDHINNHIVPYGFLTRYKKNVMTSFFFNPNTEVLS